MTSDTAKIIKKSIFAAFFGIALMSSAIATNSSAEFRSMLTNLNSKSTELGSGLIQTGEWDGERYYGFATSSGTQCPFTAKCPIDDAVSNYVNSEFSGMTEIGVYEHALVGGGVHRFRVRCN